MKLKQNLFNLFAITLLAFGGWVTIIFNVDPLKADRVALVALYTCLFIFLLGLLTFIGFGVRIYLSNREVIYAHLTPSIRQATLLSFALVGLLFLQSLRVLSVIDAGAFLLAILLLELFFRGRPQQKVSTGDEE